MARPFRILSLSGGGVRGVFQAAFLKRLQEELKTDLDSQFDLIAGPSTGAILALGIALGVGVERLVDFYKQKSAAIFARRRLAGIRPGPRYSQTVLRECLEAVFANKQLHDAKKHVVITASSLDRFNHRLFTNIPRISATDATLSAVDVALASTAGPTYFSPVKPVSEERSYADGGLWANSPSLPAIFVANHHLGIPLADIRLLAVGNGRLPDGRAPRQLEGLRPLSLSWVDTVFDLMWGCQTSFADETAAMMLARGQYINIDVSLQEPIPLDDVKGASRLPALAE